MELTRHFSLDELTRSEVALRKGLDNVPNSDQIINLKILCRTLLEPIRHLLNCPIHINSGFRSKAVNKAVGGAVKSAHLEGRAADFFPIGEYLLKSFETIRQSDLPYDQLIFEQGAWIHISFSHQPRRQAMKTNGNLYEEVA